MEDRSAAGQRTDASESFKNSFSLLQDPKKEHRETFLISDLKELESKALDVDKKIVFDDQLKKGPVQITGDLLHTEEDIKLKGAIQKTIFSAKIAVDLGESVALQQNISRKVGWSRLSATPVLKTPTFTQRGQREVVQVQNTGKTFKDLRPFQTRQVSQITDSKTSNQIKPTAQKIKRSVSFQQRPVTEKKTIRDVNGTLSPGKADRRNFQLQKAIWKERSRSSSLSPASFQTTWKTKNTSSETRLKGKVKSQYLKKRSKSKEKTEASDTEPKQPDSVKSEMFRPLELSVSKEKSQPRVTKKSSKFRNRLKSSKSEVKSNRDSKSSVQITTLQKLVVRSPRSSSTSRVFDVNAKSSPRPVSSLRLLTPKSPKSPKRRWSSTKPHEPRSSVNAQNRSALMPQEREHRTKLRARAHSAHKGGNLRVNVSHQGTSKSRSQEPNKSPRRGDGSTSRLYEAQRTLKSAQSKAEKSKSRSTHDANANNVNEVSTLEKSPQKPTLIYSLATGQKAAATTTCKVRNKTSVDQFLNRHEAARNMEKQILTSKYSPEKRIYIDVAKLTSKTRASKEASLNNSSLSCKTNSGKAEQTRSLRYSDLYNTCFSELVENSSPEKWDDSKVYEGQPKSYRHKVRFNLQNEDIIDTNPHAQRPKLRRALSDREFNKRGRFITSNINPPCGSTEMVSNRKSSQPSVACLQWIPKAPQKWPNIWSTILRSKKWRGMYPSLDFPADLSNEEDGGEDAEAPCAESEMDVSHEHDGDHPANRSRGTTSECHESPAVRRVRKKRRRSRTGKNSRRGENSPRETIFPPYTWNPEISGNWNNISPNPPYGNCGFVQSVMKEVNSFKNSSDTRIPPALSKTPVQYRITMTLQMKWAHLSELVTKEVKKECMTKGYEFMQRLTRGNPRVHSLTFLANNKSNPGYTPVEVTAVRLPYAHFASSILSLGGSSSDRHYTHIWVTSLPSHKNLLMLLHRFCTTNWVYHVTEHCSWPSLSNLIGKSTKMASSNNCQGLGENACKTIFRQICAGMAHLHQHGVLHGDLNCSNILVNNKLQVKLAGYGPVCQRMMSPLQTIKGHIQLQGDVYSISTPPEVMARRDIWTKSCDIWCMGIALLQMALGEIPHEINSAMRLSGSTKPIERFHLPTCGYQLSRLVDKILQPNASNRPSVFSISNHPWLSDGTDMAAIYAKKSGKAGTRRTDGSTFPLPKRLQNRENQEAALVSSQPVSEDAYEHDDDVRDDKEKDIEQDYYATCSSDSAFYMSLQEPLALDHDYFGDGSVRNWSQRLNNSLSPSRELVSFPTGKPEAEALGSALEEAVGQTTEEKKPALSVFTDTQPEKHKSCDLLKLMENMTLHEENEAAIYETEELLQAGSVNVDSFYDNSLVDDFRKFWNDASCIGNSI